jgi:hypothetical protein
MAGSHIAVEDADLESGGEDVGEHQHDLVSQPIRQQVGGRVGERDADHLRLGAVHDVPQDPAAAAEALSETGNPAVPTAATRADARDEDAVTRRDVLDCRTDLLDRSDGLVAQDPPVGHRRHIAFEYVQVGSADRDGVDAHERVGVVDDLWVRDLC